jgi:hypothetical protein
MIRIMIRIAVHRLPYNLLADCLMINSAPAF